MRNISLKKSKELLNSVMTMSSSDQIKVFLDKALEEAGVDRLIRPTVH
jgi:hypothetical protein